MPSTKSILNRLERRNGVLQAVDRILSGLRLLMPDWDDLAAEIVEDNAALVEAAHRKADELNAAHPGWNLSWRDLASLPAGPFDLEVKESID